MKVMSQIHATLSHHSQYYSLINSTAQLPNTTKLPKKGGKVEGLVADLNFSFSDFGMSHVIFSKED